MAAASLSDTSALATGSRVTSSSSNTPRMASTSMARSVSLVTSSHLHNTTGFVMSDIGVSAVPYMVMPSYVSSDSSYLSSSKYDWKMRMVPVLIPCLAATTGDGSSA